MPGIHASSLNSAKMEVKKKTVGICIVGLGTIGLPLAVHLAHAGFRVNGLDVSTERVASVRNATLPSEFASMLKEATKSGRLRPTLDAREAVHEAGVVFICVPTGLNDDNTIDTGNLHRAAVTLARHMQRGTLLVIESTVAVGTCRKLAQVIESESGLKAGVHFGMAHCPERYNPTLPYEALPAVYYKGQHPEPPKQTFDMINRVVGGIDTKSAKLAKAVYDQFVKGTVTELSSMEAAEATKLLENIFRDVNIALINEMAVICSKMGLNVYEVIDAAKTKPFAFIPHQPGPGVGGECIPVVPWFLIKQAEEIGLEAKVMTSARDVNDSMPAYLVTLLEAALGRAGRELSGSTVTLLGLAYKKNIDDTRLSPAFKILDILRSRGCKVIVCDPVIESFQHSSELTRLEDCFKGSDAIVLVTDHDAFSKIDFGRLREEMRTLVVVDGRNFFNGRELGSLGFSYSCIGVPIT